MPASFVRRGLSSDPSGNRSVPTCFGRSFGDICFRGLLAKGLKETDFTLGIPIVIVRTLQAVDHGAFKLTLFVERAATRWHRGNHATRLRCGFHLLTRF